MNRKCELCNRRYWERGVEPLLADDRFCVTCAIEACERELDRRDGGGVDVWKVECEHCHRFTTITRKDAMEAFGV